MRCANEKELARFVSGLVEPEAAAALREHLEHCPRCNELKSGMAATTARLLPDAGELDAPDLAADVMASIRTAPARPAAQPRRRRAWLWIPLVAFSATAILLVVRPFSSSDGTDGFRRRGGAADPDRWVSVEIFRADGTGYERVKSRIAADDALAFAYANAGDEGYRRLNILAVDERGDVFWYYPEPGREAGGLPIGRTTRSELADQIRHQLRPGLLRLFALFSKEPTPSAELERLVRRDLREAGTLQRLGRLGLAGTGQQTFLLTVAPARDAGTKVGRE